MQIFFEKSDYLENSNNFEEHAFQSILPCKWQQN